MPPPVKRRKMNHHKLVAKHHSHSNSPYDQPLTHSHDARSAKNERSYHESKESVRSYSDASPSASFLQNRKRLDLGIGSLDLGAETELRTSIAPETNALTADASRPSSSKNTPIVPNLANDVPGVLDAVAPVASPVKSIVNSVSSVVPVADSIKPVVSLVKSIANPVESLVRPVESTVDASVRNTVLGVSDVAESLGVNVDETVGSTASDISNVPNVATSLVSDPTAPLSSTLDNVGSNISRAGSPVVSTLDTSLQDTANQASHAGSDVSSVVNDTVTNVGSAVDSTVSAVDSGANETVTNAEDVLLSALDNTSAVSSFDHTTSILSTSSLLPSFTSDRFTGSFSTSSSWSFTTSTRYPAASATLSDLSSSTVGSSSTYSLTNAANTYTASVPSTSHTPIPSTNWSSSSGVNSTSAAVFAAASGISSNAPFSSPTSIALFARPSNASSLLIFPPSITSTQNYVLGHSTAVLPSSPAFKATSMSQQSTVTAYSRPPSSEPTRYATSVVPVAAPLPTSSDSSASSSSSNSNDTPPAGTIAGGVVGGAAGLAVLLILIMLFSRWYRRRAQLGHHALASSGGFPDDNDGTAVMANHRLGMAERAGVVPLIGAAVPALFRHQKRLNSAGATAPTTSERGFTRVSGRKLPSQFSGVLPDVNPAYHAEMPTTRSPPPTMPLTASFDHRAHERGPSNDSHQESYRDSIPEAPEEMLLSPGPQRRITVHQGGPYSMASTMDSQVNASTRHSYAATSGNGSELNPWLPPAPRVYDRSTTPLSFASSGPDGSSTRGSRFTEEV